MATKRNTLDKAGYTYNPFTALDWWGHPSGLHLTALENRDLLLGADDSAIPELGHPALRTPRNPLGSDTAAEWKSNKRKEEAQWHAQATLVAFIGILVLALWMKPPGAAVQ